VEALTEVLPPSPGLLVPMVVRGRSVGVLSLVNTSGRPDTLGADLELVADLARRAGIALDNARLFGQRTRIAARLQESLLPERLPDVPGVEVAVRYATAEDAVDVGGDFYDLVPLSDREHLVVIGDVSGRGVDAATVTGLARHTLRAFAHEPSPAAGLRRLGQILHAQGDAERFVTAVTGRLTRLDDGRATVRLARAGHTYPVLVPARPGGEVRLVLSEGPLLGAASDVIVEEVEQVLEPGDALVLYTDGITETRRGEELFGEDRLMAALAAAAGAPAEGLADAVLAAVDAFRVAPSEDDLALLVLRLAPAGDFSGNT
jgi:serine phosphatase RsbU (regulator of sigma subunit)